MAHADVALDIERRAASEAERLHVGVHLRLEHTLLRERALERADELLVHRTPVGRKTHYVVRRPAARSARGAGIARSPSHSAARDTTLHCSDAARWRRATDCAVPMHQRRGSRVRLMCTAIAV